MLTGETNLFSEPAFLEQAGRQRNENYKNKGRAKRFPQPRAFGTTSDRSRRLRSGQIQHQRKAHHHKNPIPDHFRRSRNLFSSAEFVYTDSRRLSTAHLTIIPQAGHGPGKGLNDAFRSIAKTTSTASTSRGSQAAVAAVRSDFKLPRASVAAVELFKAPRVCPFTQMVNKFTSSRGCGLHHREA